MPAEQMYSIALGLWGAFLVGAVFYSARVRHPDARPLAAYLIFITVFSAAAATLFGIGIAILGATETLAVLDRPVAAVAFLVPVFVPAFLLARWLVRQPPRAGPRP